MTLLEVIQERVFGHTEEEDAEDAHAVAIAESALAASQGAWYKALMEWLDRETDRPFVVASPTEMVISGTRANTLREVRERILKDVRRAESRMRERR